MLICLPYRRGKDEGRALRYTLRGIAAFVPDPTVIFLGEPEPEPWLRNVIIDSTVRDLATRDSVSNVIAKLFHFCHEWLNQETFLLFHDDIILLEPLRMNTNHVLPADTPKPGIHQKFFDDTLSRLAKQGKPPWECQDYESHSPMFMRAADVCAAIKRWGVNPYAYRTLIGNWATPAPFPVRTLEDMKVRGDGSIRVDLPYFSVTDDAARSNTFNSLMAATFPLPCRFEAGIPWPQSEPPLPPIPPPSASPSSEGTKPSEPRKP